MVQQVTERIDVCVEDETVNYLNRKDVQNALHARLIGDNKWAVCSRYLMLNLYFPSSLLKQKLEKRKIRF